MLPAGSGTGFPYPQGDADSISSAAAGLSQAARLLDEAAGRVSSAATGVGDYWHGPAANAFQEAVDRTRDGMRHLAGYHNEAADALRAYAVALGTAQSAARRAAHDYEDAQQSYNATINRLRSDPPPGAAASRRAREVTDRAATSLNDSLQRATTEAYHAVGDARLAARRCAAKLSQISADLRDTALHKFLDMMGGPGTVFGALGVTFQGKSALMLWNTLRAMDTGDFARLAKLYPKQYGEIVESAVSKYGTGSMEALEAQYRFEESVAEDAFGELSSATTGLNALPAGKLAGALDVLGKVGVVTAVAADVATVFFDGQAKPQDKAVAGLNLAGLGMAAMGNEAVAGVVSELLTVDVATSWVPGVGEVLVAGTAVYMGAEWIQSHWTDIEHWASAVGSGLATGYHAVAHAVDWAGQEIQHGEQAVQAGLDDANNWVVHNIPGAGTAEHVVSDLDPLNW